MNKFEEKISRGSAGKVKRGTSTSPQVEGESVYYERGVAALKEGRYNDAISELEKALKLNPDNDLARGMIGEAHFRNGLFFYKEGKWSNAIASFRNAVTSDPSNLKYLHHLGLAYHKNRNINKATEVYEAALKVSPGDLGVRYDLALAYVDGGKGEALREFARETMNRDGAEAERWVWEWFIALSSVMLGDYKGAIDLLKKIEKENRGRLRERKSAITNLLWGIGLLELKEGDFKDAEEYIGRVLGSLKDSPAVNYYFGLALLGLGRINEAVEYMERAFNLGFSGFEARQNLTSAICELASSAEAGGDKRRSVELLEKALRIHPASPGIKDALIKARFRYGLALAREGKIEEAIAEWSRVEALEPKNIDLLQNLALAYERLEQHETARRYWHMVIKGWKKEYRARGKERDKTRMDEGDEKGRIALYLGVAHRHMGKGFMREGEFDRAVYEYEQAIRYRPDDMGIRLELGEAEFARGNRDKAISICEEVLKVDPENLETLKMLSNFYAEEGDSEEALKYMERVVAKDPHDVRNRSIFLSRCLDLAEEFCQENDYEEAIKYLEKAHAIIPEDPRPLILWGVIKFETADGSRKSRQEGRELFQEAIALGQGKKEVPLKIGLRLLSIGEVRAAQEYVDMALAMAPPDEPTLYAIGRAYWENGKKKVASQYFERMAQISEEKGKVYAAIAFSFLKDYDLEGAFKYLRKALKEATPPLEPEIEGWIHMALLVCYVLYKFDFEKAEEEADKAEECFKRVEDRDERMDLLLELKRIRKNFLLGTED